MWYNVSPMKKAKLTPMESFWEKVDKTPGHGPNGTCWLWTAAKNNQGYGKFKFDGRAQYAHRVAFQVYTGDIPDGLCVLHGCDTPLCVNPDHLSLGTKQDNTDQMVARCRSARGERHGSAKLTAEYVREIRGWWATGDATQTALARVYGVGLMTINDIINRRAWTHVT